MIEVAPAGVTIKKTLTDNLIGEKFNNQLWRKLLSEVCKEIDINHVGLDVISPFGFELLEDKSFLSHKLRRFYAYIGAPRHLNLDQEKMTSQFKQVFFEKLKYIKTRMLDDIVIVIENHKLNKLCQEGYQCKLTDKLIDIQFRPVDTDILTDYANYTVATLDGVHHEKGEGKEFRTNKMWRWRLYQLYIMQEQLFGSLLPPMTINEHKNYKAIFEVISNMIQLFYAPNMMAAEPTEQEKDIIFQLIKPRIATMYEVVKPRSYGDTKVIKCHAYHYDDDLELTLDLELYHQVINKIKRTYLEFG